MTLYKIRQNLAEQITQSEEWINYLNDSNPGHYGVIDSDISLSYEDIWVDVPQKTFTFKNASFHFELQLGSSNENDGIQDSFDRLANGNGTFDFINGKSGLSLGELEVEFDLELFRD